MLRHKQEIFEIWANTRDVMYRSPAAQLAAVSEPAPVPRTQLSLDIKAGSK